MPKTTSASLTADEKAIVKSLLNNGWRNQDVHALINTGRNKSVNFARISGVKNDKGQKSTDQASIEAFIQKKRSFDHVTGLCPFDDERMVRARESMLLAVQLFNTPRLVFKTSVFAMLSNVSWTYLMHEYYDRKGVNIVKENGFSLALSEMTTQNDCPLTVAMIKNLAALKLIRDAVEHKTIGQFDRKWVPILQDSCLNFEKAITDLFGERLTLGSDLGFVIQFSKMSAGDISMLQNTEVPKHISSLDAELAGDDADNIEYQFKVVYTLTSASKSKANFHFVLPDSDEGQEMQNVLIKFKPKDDIYPFKPADVIAQVRKATGRKFTSDKHQKAWKLYKVRPRGGTAKPSDTNEKYCAYHPAFSSYTYSKSWVEFLISELADDGKWQTLLEFKTS